MRLVDSHCHLDAAEFDPDRGEVLARAVAAGVRDQIVPAVAASGWPKLRALCADATGLHPAYGLHPMYLAEHQPEHLSALRDWIERERPVAVGECGLDHFVDGLDRDAQRRIFEAQLQLALEFDLPAIVHARRAVDAVVASIRTVGGNRGRLRGVVHSFSGSAEQTRHLAKLGFLVGLGGPVTYERAQRLRRLATTVPLDWLLLETDAPDQPDAGIRGQRNEPARLVPICEAIAALRGMSPEALARATSDNAQRLFRLSPDERVN